MSKRIVRSSGAGAVVALVAVLLVASAPIAGAASGKSVSADRWIRGVCRETSDWLDARAAARERVAAVTADLTAGELSGKKAAKQLAAAYAGASTDTQQAIDAIRGAGTPKVPGGKTISGSYQDRLAEYQDAYDAARKSIGGAATSDVTAFATSATEVEATLTSDLGVVGGDPLEDLRADEALSTAITASCTDVDQHLGATVDAAGCRAALVTAREYNDVIEKVAATAEGSPEETALVDQMWALVTRWRTESGGCNAAAVLGACRLPLETSQAVVKAAADYEATPDGSPEEAAAESAWIRLDTELTTQLPKCTA